MNPLQSTPLNEVPPHKYGTPINRLEVLTKFNIDINSIKESLSDAKPLEIKDQLIEMRDRYVQKLHYLF